MLLSDEEKRYYLEKVILPGYQAAAGYDKLELSIYDHDAKLRFTSNYIIKVMNLKYQELLGKSYADITLEDIQISVNDELKNELAERLLHSTRKIDQLLKLTINLPRVINYIDFLPYNGLLEAYEVCCTPIFHPNGEVVGVQTAAYKYRMFEINSILTSQLKTPEAITLKDSQLPIQLSPRQHEMLYLIVHGFPQEYIAQMLQIQRGTLARIVSEHICPKFGIHGSNTKLLMEKAINLGFKNFIPKSLWYWGVIIPDPEIAQLVNA